MWALYMVCREGRLEKGPGRTSIMGRLLGEWNMGNAKLSWKRMCGVEKDTCSWCVILLEVG
jgi:hypothetical protein